MRTETIEVTLPKDIVTAAKRLGITKDDLIHTVDENQFKDFIKRCKKLSSR